MDHTDDFGPEEHHTTYRRHSISVTRDAPSECWYIVVVAPSGARGYDGWWPDSENKSWQEAVEEAKHGACLIKNRATPATAPQATQPGADAMDDTKLLNFLRDECCDLRCDSSPTGGDDSEVYWKVIEHHMAEPHEREIGRSYSDEPRQAIRAAMAAKEL